MKPRPFDLPLPPFYEPKNARSWAFGPRQDTLLGWAQEWRQEHEIPPSASDAKRIRLLLVDAQKDFCFPEGSLYVGGRSGTGALGDNDRIARFVYRNLAALTDIACTMDTHFPFQIFFPSFWLDDQGGPPAPHREISTADVRSGSLVPNPAVAWWLCNGNTAWLRRQVEFYCAELEQEGKYALYLWPPHCILGSDGHALSGVVHEARMFHAFVRGSRNSVQTKGGNALTEHYSALSPEVPRRHDGGFLAERDASFVKELLEADALIVAGQAASHCVKSTLDDLLAEIRRRDASLARKVYILKDCMSSVAVPDPERKGRYLFDFTPQAEEALARFASAGMWVLESTRPLESWPEFPLPTGPAGPEAR